jgi:hypothetical protein
VPQKQCPSVSKTGTVAVTSLSVEQARAVSLRMPLAGLGIWSMPVVMPGRLEL